LRTTRITLGLPIGECVNLDGWGIRRQDFDSPVPSDLYAGDAEASRRCGASGARHVHLSKSGLTALAGIRKRRTHGAAYKSHFSAECHNLFQIIFGGPPSVGPRG
jgi:hypothetical protein